MSPPPQRSLTTTVSLTGLENQMYLSAYVYVHLHDIPRGFKVTGNAHLCHSPSNQ